MPRFFALATAVVLVLAVLVLPPAPLFRDRSFFGVTVVVPSRDGARLEILNGTTLHGVQYRDPARRMRPATYYAERGPIGDVFRRLGDLDVRPNSRRTVGIVGLGAGSLAAYANAGERWTYFEIDPVVARVAQDPAYFTFLSGAAARPEVVIGDGRLELRRVADGTFDLLVLDAFSSDAIPAHLLTVEALRDAMRTVAPGGLLAVHVSNRYYDLAPAVAAAARDLGARVARARLRSGRHRPGSRRDGFHLGRRRTRPGAPRAAGRQGLGEGGGRRASCRSPTTVPTSCGSCSSWAGSARESRADDRSEAAMRPRPQRSEHRGAIRGAVGREQPVGPPQRPRRELLDAPGAGQVR